MQMKWFENILRTANAKWAACEFLILSPQSTEVGGMIAGCDQVWKQTVLFLHVVFADVSLSMQKSSFKSGADYFVVSYYFVPCTFQRDFSNGVEYCEGSENIVLLPEAFLKKGINGYKYEDKRWMSFQILYMQLGPKFMMGYELLLKNAIENIWLSGLHWSKNCFNSSILRKIGFVCIDYIILRRAQANAKWPQPQGPAVCHS